MKIGIFGVCRRHPVKIEKRYKDLAMGLTASAGLLVLGLTRGPYHYLNDGHFHWDTVLILTGLLGALVLSLFRFHKNVALRDELLRLREHEVRFSERALDAHNIVSITDADARILDVNEKFLQTFGYTRSEVLGKKADFIHPYDQGKSVFLEIKSCVSNGETWSGVHVGYTKSGEKKYFQCSVVPLRDQNGKHVKSISVRTDVTTARVAEADRQMNALLDNLQDEVYIYRVDDLSVVYMNKAACARCEWSPQTYKGKRIVDTDNTFTEKRLWEHVAPLLSGEKTSVVSEARQEKGYVEISTRLYIDAKGNQVFISVLRDIDERKRLDQAKMSSVSVVSHELRTPLTSITGALRMLQNGSGGPFSTDAQAMIDIAARNSERLLFIVNDIMDLEKIQAGKMEFHHDRIDLPELVKDAVRNDQKFAEEHGVRLELEGLERAAFITGDRGRLLQVMTNLISNASKYSPDGGTVTVELKDAGKGWRVSVTDRGPGIAEDDQIRLFESFSQTRPADGKRRPGTGLGLAICKMIIRKHDGKIGVKSAVGQGSTFYFDLPKLHDAHAALPDGHIASVATQQTPRDA